MSYRRRVFVTGTITVVREADPDVLADIGIIPWEEGQTAIAGVYRRREQQRLEDIYGADMADAHRATTDQSSELQ